MPELEQCKNEIERILGVVKAADGIKGDLTCTEEKWLTTVINELDKLSKQVALDYGKQNGIMWDKKRYKLYLEETPQGRFYGYIISLSVWLGWILQEKQKDYEEKYGKKLYTPLSPEISLCQIISAFEYGRNLSKNNKNKGGKI